jgi:tetratricopeptide (TPR) repeat protein
MKASGAAALVLAALATAAGAGAQKPAVEQHGIFEDLGNLTDAAEDGAGIWLSLWQPYVRFRIEAEPEAKRNQLLFLINRATQGYRSVSIRYDAAGGRLNRQTGTLDYPLCALALDELRFEPSRACKVKTPAALNGPEAALVMAQAYLASGDFQRTKDLLARSDLPADVAFRKIFLKVRAAATDGVASTETPLSLAADQAAAASLADYRALALLEPDDVEHHFAVARALQDLGGYAEASAAYDVLLKRWPDEDFRVAVRRGALYRGQGEYEKALDVLNQLVARNLLYDGMKFRYHRAWTLSLLGRHDEAIADLSEGLRTQPDYASAYTRRACAYSAIGRLREASEDVGQAARLYSAYPGADKALRHEIAEIEALRAQIEAALAQGAGKRISTGCTGPYWRIAERPRPRSALLPPSKP